MKIGIIGFGDMGKLFASKWSNLGHQIFACDLPQNYQSLSEEYSDYKNIRIEKDGFWIVKNCDFVLYAVESENIDSVVQKYAQDTSSKTIVSAQTSVKHQESLAFNKYLPKNVNIVGSHALFGPNVDPIGQTVVIYNERSSLEAFETVKKLYCELGVQIKELDSADSHDKIMADIQAVTHIGFESIGTALMHRGEFPWESKSGNGLDNLKLLLTLRIYSYKHHVYQGMALLNPYAKSDIRKYAKVENEIFGLMISENKQKFISKIKKARDLVFKNHSTELLLNNEILNQYSLNNDFEHKPNSHLSLLSMVSTWADLKINPYSNVICQTPPFKLRVGMAEYLFLNDDLLEESINAALYDKSIRIDDLCFHTAVHEWANIVETGDKKSYEIHFKKTKKFLEPRLNQGREISSKLITQINNKNKLDENS
jgi:prephenate dehydrogenase (NADP+)